MLLFYGNKIFYFKTMVQISMEHLYLYTLGVTTPCDGNGKNFRDPQWLTCQTGHIDPILFLHESHEVTPVRRQ